MISVYIVEESTLARRELEELVRGAGVEVIFSAASIDELEKHFAEEIPAGIIITSDDSARLGAMLEQAAASDLFQDVPIVVLADAAYDAAAFLRAGVRSVLS